MKKEVWTAAATLMATTIGAGILGLPYVFAKSGFLIGTAYIILFTTVYVIMSFFVAEIVLRTKEQHQLVGLAGRYLGKKGKIFYLIITMLAFYGSLVAYLIALGQAFNSIFGGAQILWSLACFFAFSLILYYDIDVFKKSENILILALIAIIISIVIFSIPHADTANLSAYSLSSWFFPYGVVLFAFMGLSAIPMMKEELSDLHDFKTAILIGVIGSGALYLLFSYAMVGLLGMSVSEVATVGIGAKLGAGMNIIANLLAILTLSTSFIAVGYALKESYFFDVNLGGDASFLTTMIIPIAIVLLGVTGFISALNYVGGIGSGLILLFMIMILRKARARGDRKPEFTAINSRFLEYILMSIFLIGLIHTII
ncbi:hypothetical protein JW968_02875 [Candidatus Woesearchaeota archaeon]|nr:hypothetical protein [Candidatus Woesearchaeota archaeon]